jgi:hypothetical protein
MERATVPVAYEGGHQEPVWTIPISAGYQALAIRPVASHPSYDLQTPPFLLDMKQGSTDSVTKNVTILSLLSQVRQIEV